MKCVVCKQGETNWGAATVTLEKETTTLVVKSVPANLCVNCGEAYIDESTTEALLTMVKRAAENGVQVEVREYAPLDSVVA